ncbi:meiotic chromosome segregation protein [Grosmannia clavigera kw1407]|uniref:Meiotic chromosome segregation protein n=1 Tax=Grosmannia clavigera (strain kw1407 / UAMH 11150) TaxID=655863 RepID=F0XEJ9_GROCL|nr:meiotic chromosome segregation protein [Grosmannia clavigera kw1407]EFX03653.1 meiotic chromosome segregation protein [Grosmannia clavigera kw1407]
MPQPPPPAYDPLPLDRALYETIATSERVQATALTVPVRSGRAWIVRAGQVCRITTPMGPQVGDLNVWNAHNPRERFWAARTRQLQQSHGYGGPGADGVDAVGGRVHDLLGTRCDPYVDQLISGSASDVHCHSNLVRAVLPFGLHESDVHDVLNVFQVTGLDSKGRYYMEPCPAKAGDYWEFFAEIDVLCAISACPGGDLSNWGWGEAGADNGLDMADCCRPLVVEVYDIVDRDTVLKNWKSPEPAIAAYKGVHGLVGPDTVTKTQ